MVTAMGHHADLAESEKRQRAQKYSRRPTEAAPWFRAREGHGVCPTGCTQACPSSSWPALAAWNGGGGRGLRQEGERGGVVGKAT